MLIVVDNHDKLYDGTYIIAIELGIFRSAFAYGIAGGERGIVCSVPKDSVMTSIAVKAESLLVLNNNKKAIGFGWKGRKRVYASGDPASLYLFQNFMATLMLLRTAFRTDTVVMTPLSRLTPAPVDPTLAGSCC